MRFKAIIDLDLSWEFEVEAENEDQAYEELWHIVGYDAEGILDLDSDSEYMDISMRPA